jgi:hypothetical protein
MDLCEEGIATPPDCVYTSYEEAYNALKNHGSKPHHSETKTRYYYQCDRSRNYQSQATVRSTSTCTTGSFQACHFQDEERPVKLEVRDKDHNHPRSLNSSAHHVYRKRTSSCTCSCTCSCICLRIDSCICVCIYLRICVNSCICSCIDSHPFTSDSTLSNSHFYRSS